ncbi:pirin family protein [Nannocystis sp. ILAH1]|uniref:pirin family protein n=1 Tax=unclassified Nannocystis TaxID=2627009 RepID=UPI00226F4D67|nr:MULTISPECIES: pirin family protein [unclassified Nannocystis]MCY0989167.1 pirin family protein [Nannocystis sp. ILAH1]MCY1067899.1 pirin family protein [Nannocystis sp. RBIL2]
MQADDSAETAIELEIAARPRRLDAFEVGRVLPAPVRRMVGPFAFFDHMGPAHLEPGLGMDVRPHPHIGLATVTYLFEGEILHRDSLGSLQPIRPGAINWMTAGRGIVHSERSPAEARAQGPKLHGLQLWVALPREAEESEPAFSHHPTDTIPELSSPGVRVRVLAGSAYGVTAPTPIASPLVYVEAHLEAGATFELPPATERAVYVIEGELRSGDRTVPPRTMAVLRSGKAGALTATAPTRMVLIGGEPLSEPRFIWWNFVSSSQERIVQAAHEWKEQRFPRVPGDEKEWIPLVDEPKFAPP